MGIFEKKFMLKRIFAPAKKQMDSLCFKYKLSD